LERTVRVRLEASVGDIPRLFPVFDANEPHSFGKFEQSAFDSNPNDRAGAPFIGLSRVVRVNPSSDRVRAAAYLGNRPFTILPE
jgi:hypothetical protein